MSLQLVKGKRGRAKASLSVQLIFSGTIREDTPISTLEIHFSRLTEAWSEFNVMSDKMYEFYDSEGFVDPESDFAEYEDKYLRAYAAIDSAIRLKTPVPSPPEINVDSISESLSSQQSQFLKKIEAAHSSTSSVLLPKLVVPTFNGDYKDWPGFKDIFLGTIDSNKSLTGTQKFQYLKFFLGTQPADLFKNTPCTDKNYVEAWKKLEERYDRTNLIVQCFIKSFLSLPSVNSPNASVLRNIFDQADEVIRGLSSLEITSRDPWVIYILIQKLDYETKQEWTNKVGTRTDCTIEEFLEFLQTRCNCLEACDGPLTSDSSTTKRTNYPQRSVRTHMVQTKIGCPKCKEYHFLSSCNSFASLKSEARRDFVRENKLCFNCFRPGHASNRCRLYLRCKLCNKRHNTLVHPTEQVAPTVFADTSSSGTPRPTNVNCNSLEPYKYLSTLLPTAVVIVKDTQGTAHELRALLDTGSQVSFITEQIVQRLGLSRKPSRIPIMGVASTSAGVTNGIVSLNLCSRLNTNNIEIDCYVISKLTSLLPTAPLVVPDAISYNELELADPYFNKPSAIDILIGADKVFEIIKKPATSQKSELPHSIPTIFGWVIAGNIEQQYSLSNQQVKTFCTQIDLTQEFDLERFWRLEEVHTQSILSLEEEKAEQHFITTHTRSPDGRYIVQLPLKQDFISKLCNSFGIALNRLRAMERRFLTNPDLKAQYDRFLTEYLELGHMEEIFQKEVEVPLSDCYYLPHHAVLKSESTTTKCRVVFDGSAKPNNSTKSSLNELLLVGPTIQHDIFAICLRSRRHVYVISGDIEKMFRQILIAPQHANYQRIIWRVSPEERLRHFKLLTDTYGTSSAPFSSVRVLKQLALDYAKTHPRASNVILNDFYVDDVFSGADSIEDVMSLRIELVELLKLGGFNLRKWTTNCWPLLLSLPEDQREMSPIEFEESSVIKVLGLQWCPSKDFFSYKVVLPQSANCTKRRILSDASRIFDPLGFLSPIVIAVKIFFQDLWRDKISWDDEVPEEIANRWKSIRDQLSLLESISIPRIMWSNPTTKELHGFCDASLDAYASVIYCRSVDSSGNVMISLVAAKSRVAPIKVLSLPKLELCGALLLTRLINKIKDSLREKDIQTYAWTDSSIVLHWLAASPKKWSVFVANRTSEIQTSLPFKCWNHVRSPENPADVATRGISPSILLSTDIWWQGPSWLKDNPTEWPVSEYSLEGMPIEDFEERKGTKVQVLTSNLNSENFIENLISNHSNWTKLTRVVAYVNRYLRNLRFKSNRTSLSYLSTKELEDAETLLIKSAQMTLFSAEINSLNNSKQLSCKNKLLTLTPFLDKCNILRVGGRLKNSDLTYNEKHPIILCKSHPISTLIVENIHKKYLHAGLTLMVALVKQKYHIIGLRNLLRKTVFGCLACFRQRQTSSQQLMGDLPMERVRFSRPFSKVGCDFAGPIQLRSSRGRNPKFTKGYIALFVCFVTKGIHIELVGDLSTDAFLQALDRFVARRGKPSEIWSDNATNFHGAKRKLNELYDLLLIQQRSNIIIDHLSKDRIEWKFNPPSAPHFGGLWEAGVKSIKAHLKRVIGDHKLTYEEMYTLLTNIESVLNSRPMWKTSDLEPSALTPSHFMIGESYSAVPTPDISIKPISIRNNWSLLQALMQGFWKRWHQEYLTSLQILPKWQKAQPNLQINDVVLLKEPNLPPSKWLLGRVIELHLGKDGHCRVVTVKTSGGIYVRPIVKLAPLPFSERPESSRGG